VMASPSPQTRARLMPLRRRSEGEVKVVGWMRVWLKLRSGWHG
jgi:hypothetical protein